MVVAAVVEGVGGGGWRRRRVVEAEGGFVSSLYPHCIPTVSSLYPSKERCLWSPAVAEGGGGGGGGGWWWWRVAEAEGGGGGGWWRWRAAASSLIKIS